jgi:lactate permease
MIGVIGAIYAIGQVEIAALDPVLAGIIPASLGLLALYPLSRWSRYADEPETVDELHALEDDRAGGDESQPVMSTPMALMPYGVLTLVAITFLTVGPLREALESVQIGPSFPAAGTGAGVENDAEAPYSPFTPLTHPGLFLLLGAGAAAFFYARRGYVDEWKRRRSADESREEDEESGLGTDVVSDAAPASVAIVSFLVFSSVMEHSGQVASLAEGIGNVAPAALYTSLAATIGAIGAFMTTSNTASNVLFAPLQQAVAEAQGLSESAIISGQHAGGAIGNSVAPANIVLGTGTAGIGGQEGAVLRRVLPFALTGLALVGAATFLLETL